MACSAARRFVGLGVGSGRAHLADATIAAEGRGPCRRAEGQAARRGVLVLREAEEGAHAPFNPACS